MTDQKIHKCTVCGKPSPLVICNNCEAHIRADAVGEKKKSEKSVNIGADVIADRVAGHKTGSK